MKHSNSNALPIRFDSNKNYSRVSLGSAVSFGEKEKLNKISEESKFNLAFEASATDNSVDEEAKAEPNLDLSIAKKLNLLQSTVKHAVGNESTKFDSS